MKFIILGAFLTVLVGCSETCENRENSVSTFLTTNYDHICPMQSVTARCIFNSTRSEPELFWRCDHLDETGPERIIVCSDEEIFPLSCSFGSVMLTLVDCECNNSTIISEATFLATSGIGNLQCGSVSNEDDQKHIPVGAQVPSVPVLNFTIQRIQDVENSSVRNVTVEWTSSRSDQYQYLVRVASSHFNSMNDTTSLTMINLTLTINVTYRIYVTAQRCNGFVKSNSSNPLDITIPVPDAVRTCRATPVYSEVELFRIDLEWIALPDNNSITIGVTVNLQGYEISFPSDNTTLMVNVSILECAGTCQYNIMQTILPNVDSYVTLAGMNQFGSGLNTVCTDNKIGITNTFVKMKELNQMVIIILGEVLQTEVTVSCGKNISELKQCASHTGVFEGLVHLETFKSFADEYEQDTIYHYEIYNANFSVLGNITSNGVTPSTDSSPSAAVIAATLPTIFIIIILLLSVTIIISSVIFWKVRLKWSFVKVYISCDLLHYFNHLIMPFLSYSKKYGPSTTPKQDTPNHKMDLKVSEEPDSTEMTETHPQKENIQEPTVDLKVSEEPDSTEMTETHPQKETIQEPTVDLKVSEEPDSTEMTETHPQKEPIQEPTVTYGKLIVTEKDSIVPTEEEITTGHEKNQYKYVKEESFNPPNGRDIIGLCVTEQRVYCSDCEIQGFGRKYSVRVFNREKVGKKLEECCKVIGFEHSRGIGVYENNIYIADSDQNKVVKFDEKFKLQCYAKGIGDELFDKPYGVLVTDVYVFVCEKSLCRIFIFDHDLNLRFLINDKITLCGPTDISHIGTRYFVIVHDGITVLDINFNEDTFTAQKMEKMALPSGKQRTFERMRGICTTKEYIYVTEALKHILCLKYEKPQEHWQLSLVAKIENVSPLVIAQHNEEIYYSRKDAAGMYEIMKVTHKEFKVCT